jgi:drug/metabolite transporter (DMT)-like permease
MTHKNNLKLGIIFALCAIAVFSVMNAAIKGIETTYPPVQVAFMRFLISLIPCFGFYFAEKNRPPLFVSTKLTLKHLLRGVMSAIGITALCAAFRILPFGDATAISFSSILFITALSVPMLGQHVDRARWIAVLVGFIGILIIAQPGGDIFEIGALYILIYAAVDAYVIVSGRLLSKEHSPGAATAVFCLFATLATGIVAYFVWKDISSHDLIILVSLGLLGGVGFLFQTIAYNFAPASVIAPMAYSGMLWGGVFGFVFWGEIPNLTLIIGGILIIGSGYYIIRREARGY